MRRLIVPMALIASFGLGSAALAADSSTTATKKAACEKQWKAEKNHTSSQADFMKVCMAKG